MVRLVTFLTLLLMGLVSGISFSHLLQWGPKTTLPGPHFLSVQQVLLRNYGVMVGGLEVAAFILTLLLALLVRSSVVTLALIVLTCCSVGLMILIWALWINGINRTVNSWKPDSIPANWTEFRDRWHQLHAIRTILALTGQGALILATLIHLEPGP
jgi:hypothetical protein